jgi:hypothetical protein
VAGKTGAGSAKQITRTLLTAISLTLFSQTAWGEAFQLKQGFRLKNVRIIGLVAHPPHNNFTSWFVVDVFDSNTWLAEEN